MSTRNLPIEMYTGTAGGSLSGIVAAISPGDLAQTIVLAIVGTVVSFFDTVGLNRLLKKKRRWENE